MHIHQTMKLAGGTIKTFTVLRGFFVSWIVTLSVVMVLFGIDNILRLPSGIRLPLAIGIGLALCFIWGGRFLKPVIQKIRPERTALELEKRFGIQDNVLINACQFVVQELSEQERVFANQTIQAAQKMVTGKMLESLRQRRFLWKWGFSSFVVAMFCLGYAMLWPRYFVTAWLRYVHPLDDVPPASVIVLNVLPDSDISVYEGDHVQIVLKMEYPKSLRESDLKQPFILWQEGLKYIENESTSMEASMLRRTGMQTVFDGEMPLRSGFTERRYTYQFTSVRTSFAFRIFAGDIYTRSIYVSVHPFPKIKASSFHVAFPSYTGHKPLIQPGPPSSVAALPGSEIGIQIEADQPVVSLCWKSKNRSVPFVPMDDPKTLFRATSPNENRTEEEYRAKSESREKSPPDKKSDAGERTDNTGEASLPENGRFWTASVTIDHASPYELEATIGTGNTNGSTKQISLASGNVMLQDDLAPEIEFLTSDRNRLVSPGTSFRLELQAQDDYGIQKISITARSANDKQESFSSTENSLPDKNQTASNSDMTKASSDAKTSDAKISSDAKTSDAKVSSDAKTSDAKNYARMDDGASSVPSIKLKEYVYLGPPGSPGIKKEVWEFQIDPQQFTPGNTYLVEATCEDFCPVKHTGTSKPLILRIKSLSDLALSGEDELAKAFALLQQTIVEQRAALGATENFKVYFLEALKKDTVLLNQKNMANKQTGARARGFLALAEFKKTGQGMAYTTELEGVVQGEMLLAYQDIEKIKGLKASEIPIKLEEVEKRQNYILSRLMAILGKLAENRLKLEKQKDQKTSDADLPQVTLKDSIKQLKDDLKEFAQAQRSILERTRNLLQNGPQDLTQEEEKILGALAREEAKLAEFIQEKLTDFSKLPQQDFSDSSMSDEFNEVFQEIKLAAKSLYEQKIELAVPHEQSGLEKAEKLIHNLERWLPDIPDNKKWVMEDPKTPTDIPLADLPAELEDIVGDLIDQENQMTDDVEDVSSSWMDSLDKGAGWGTSDGPISNMSARGVTGNLLPNQNEIGGRSGEGRSGRSHGQMVEKTADGKGGRETPTRVSPGPFEQGSVEDSAKNSPGGATGGGKLSGFAEEGLRGPTPPPALQKMARLAGQQVQIRQKAEKVALNLKNYRLPSGDMETAIAQMKQMEEAAQKGYGPGIRRSFSSVMDSLQNTRKSIRTETGIRRERIQIPPKIRSEIMTGIREGVPQGYEEMVSEYFKALAEEQK